MLGIMQRALARAAGHVFFDRYSAVERERMAKELAAHANDETKLPMLMFPEGVCVNNTAIVRFKKGAFEASDVVTPIAIKYDERWGDPYWSAHGFFTYWVSGNKSRHKLALYFSFPYRFRC